MYSSNGHHPLHTRVRKRLLALTDHAKHPLYEKHKQELFQDLKGEVVLEIGPGTHPSLSHVPEGARWIGVEPNPAMHPHIRREAHKLGRSVQLCTAEVEMLPEYDESIDVVISILSLCSINNLRRALNEIYRVLKPGGTFYFIEHVAADPERDVYLWQAQVLFQQAWASLLDGCRLRFRPHEAIEQAPFSEVTYEYRNIGSPYRITRPHVLGKAVKT